VEPGRSRACGALHGEGAGGEGRLIAWAAVDPDTGGVEHEHGSQVFAAASTIKVFVYSAYRRSTLDHDEVVAVGPVGDSGVAEYLRTPLALADHAFLMLAVSDNASTNVLLERVSFDAVAEEAARLGLEQTRIRRLMMVDAPENETTALDLAHGLARLVDEPFAGDLLEALYVAGEEESFLPYLLPGVTVRLATPTRCWRAFASCTRTSPSSSVCRRRTPMRDCAPPARFAHSIRRPPYSCCHSISRPTTRCSSSKPRRKGSAIY
jgi:Beta-lactamase enzyme family